MRLPKTRRFWIGLCLGLLVLWFVARSVDYEVSRWWFDRLTGPRPDADIQKLMSEIQTKYRKPGIEEKTAAILRRWPRAGKTIRVEFEVLGIASLPYVERKLRSSDSTERQSALDMLCCFSPTGTPESQRPIPDPVKEVYLRRRYIVPIWLRTLRNQEPSARVIAIRRVIGSYPPSWSQFNAFRFMMLHDSDRAVRVEAAKMFIERYKRPYLVPLSILRDPGLHEAP
jgi:hypothetical protein